MKRTQDMLGRTQAELRNAKSLLKDKKKTEARANNHRERDTAKLERKTIEKTVKEIEDHRAILKDEE